MFTVGSIILGLILVFTGYLLHGGSMTIFIRAWTEFITILGGALGIFLASNGMPVVKASIAQILKLLKPDAYTKPEFLKLLVMLYQILNLARREGLLGIEVHLEDPHKSSILGANHLFIHDHHASSFFCDTMKVIVSGGVKPHDLADMMEMDLENMHHEENMVPDAIYNAGDAMPAVGICACVLGVIITLGKIGGDPKDLGAAIGLALVGTFAGILFAYIVFFPFSKALGKRNAVQGMYMNCIRHAIFSFARGEAPMTCVEFARRNIEPSLRPSFSEMEQAAKQKK
jgi:chemotaxis protein MotA